MLYSTSKWRLGLGLLLVFVLLLPSCTNEIQMRKSALRYFKDGNFAYRHRDFQNAIWNYRKAIELDSYTAEFHFNLGLAYYEIGNYPEALDAYLRVSQIKPKLSDTYYNIALAYNRMELSQRADLYYNRYQEMLSLRKAREHLREKALVGNREKIKGTEKTKTSAAAKINPPSPKTEAQSHWVQTQQSPSSSLEFSSPLRSETRGIPNWE